MGVILIVVVALIWAGLASCYAAAARRRLTMLPFVAISSAVGALVAGAVHVRWGGLAVSPHLGALALMMAASGITGTLGMLFSGQAMRAAPGRSAVTWTVFQMGMVVPFLTAVVLWRQPAAWYHWLALGPMAAAMALLAPGPRAQAGTAEGWEPGWSAWVAVAFVMAGVSQALGQEPNFRGWTDPMNLRAPLSMAAGGATIWTISAAARQLPTAEHWRLGVLAGLLSGAGNMILWHAMDAMAAVGRTYVVFPVAISGSIVFYALWQFARGKERADLRTKAGVFLGVAGTALLALAR